MNITNNYNDSALKQSNLFNYFDNAAEDAAKDGCETYENIKKYHLTYEEETRILIDCMLSDNSPLILDKTTKNLDEIFHRIYLLLQLNKIIYNLYYETDNNNDPKLWLIDFIIKCCKTGNLHHLSSDLIINLVKKIFRYHDQSMRYILKDHLISFMQYNFIININAFSDNREWALISNMLIFILEKISNNKLENFRNILKGNVFKDCKNFKILHNFLHLLITNKQLDNDFNVKMIVSIDKNLKQIEYENLLNNFSLFIIITNLNKLNEIKIDCQIGIFEQIKKFPQDIIIFNLLQDNFELKLDDLFKKNFLNNYENTFGKYRINNALTTYLMALSKLNYNKQKRELGIALFSFIKGVLDGNFKETRYIIENSEHLKLLFENKNELLFKWREGEKRKILTGYCSNHTIEDTDECEDLFLCGTEISTCQHIQGNAKLNQCLLAYILDGKNRLIAFKNQFGKIIARAIFKMCLDEEDKPILFLEKIYPEKQLDNFIVNTIIDFSVERAKKMELPLLMQYTGEDKTKIKYNGAIHSNNTITPYEYSDAVINNITNGEFVIGHNLLELYNPTQHVHNNNNDYIQSVINWGNVD